ncbi:MAG: cytochrome-c peroxidase [Deltaproteobacteria bacterium]|jgi:cytochrome c peroxidase|nr:cytochrome-c peroxidase [Deltaproteobacteria bacterium]
MMALLVSCGAEERSDVATDGSESATEAAEPETQAAALGLDRSALRERAKAIFGTLPAEAANPNNAITPAKVELGRVLYYEPRLSKNHDVSCNTCHLLDRHGVDGKPTSTGHREQVGGRNAPTVYNAALHIAQFWDGRAADVEEQAKGPVLNPIEMAMPSEAAAVAVLESIPGYAPLFEAAFPGAEKPISYDNMANAIGAFERKLLTPSPFDAFLSGDDDALSDEQLAGLDRFISVGCIACHQGPAIGGGLYQKLGVIKPYPTEDPGRKEITGDEADLRVFKVPSLRNIAKTGPYLHDGSIQDLDQMVRVMAEYQLGIPIEDSQVKAIIAFLGSLTGEVDQELIAMPELPPSGPNTPAPDPS